MDPGPPQTPDAENPGNAGACEGPFLRRRRTWLVAGAFGLMTAVCVWLPVDAMAAEGLDPAKIRIGLGVFLGVAFLWLTEALPLAVTALLVPVLATLLRVSDLKTALVSFADPLIFIFLGGFALAAALSRQGLDRWIARSLVRLGKGRFLTVACGLFAATAFISMWISNTATTAMMLPLALGLLASAGDSPAKSRNTVFLLLGLAYASSIGGLGTLIGSPPNGIAARQLGVSFAEWMTFGIPTVLVLLPAMVGLLYWHCRPERKVALVMASEDFAMTAPRWTTLGIFAATAACWIGGMWLGPVLGVTGSFDTLVALVAIVALLFAGVVRWRDIDRSTEWGVLLLFGGGLALSAVLSSTGASLFLARLLGEQIGGWPPLMIVAAVVAFVISLTELTSNTACAALFVPIFHALAGELGMEAAQLVTPLALAASCAFMLPVATPPNAIVFGSGKVPQRAMVRAGVLLNLVFVGLLTLLSRLLF